MRHPRRLMAGIAAALLTFGLAACEVDEGALEDMDDPGFEEEGEEF